MNETLTRTFSGILYILILISASLFSTSFYFLFGVFLVISVIEFCQLVKLQPLVPVCISVLLYIGMSYFTLYKSFELIALFFTLFVAVKAMLFLFENNTKPVNAISKYLYLIGYIIFPMVFITKLPFVENSFQPKIIISIFILIWTNDTMAFVVGKSIGKVKLFERISPKKTVEGFIGGLVFAVVTSIAIALHFMYQPLFYWILIALIVAIFGTIGDLVESKFKRVAAVKDSGKIMPGHGGILDRFDSVLFVGPFVFLFYQILNYVS